MKDKNTDLTFIKGLNSSLSQLIYMAIAATVTTDANLMPFERSRSYFIIYLDAMIEEITKNKNSLGAIKTTLKNHDASYIKCETWELKPISIYKFYYEEPNIHYHYTVLLEEFGCMWSYTIR